MCNFRNLLLVIEGLFNSRTIEGMSDTKLTEYEDGEYNPVFSIIVRDDKSLACVWYTNRRKNKYKKEGGSRKLVRAEEQELARVSANKIREGFTPDEWDAIGLKVLHAYGEYLAVGDAK